MTNDAMQLWTGEERVLGVGGGVGDVLTATESIGSGILPIAVLVSISNSAIRFRRSSGRERLQFKWIVYTATLTAASFLVSFMQPARVSLWLRDRRRKEGRKAEAKCEKIPREEFRNAFRNVGETVGT